MTVWISRGFTLSLIPVNAAYPHGAAWEDRYHATAIEINEHLQRCLVYIDLTMVRARVVTHPGNWAHSGYREIQKPSKRCGIDLGELSSLCGFAGVTDFQQTHAEAVVAAFAFEVYRILSCNDLNRA